MPFFPQAMAVRGPRYAANEERLLAKFRVQSREDAASRQNAVHDNTDDTWPSGCPFVRLSDDTSHKRRLILLVGLVRHCIQFRIFLSEDASFQFRFRRFVWPQCKLLRRRNRRCRHLHQLQRANDRSLAAAGMFYGRLRPICKMAPRCEPRPL